MRNELPAKLLAFYYRSERSKLFACRRLSSSRQGTDVVRISSTCTLLRKALRTLHRHDNT